MNELIEKIAQTINEINEIERRIEEIQLDIGDGKAYDLQEYGDIAVKYRELVELKSSLKSKLVLYTI